VSSQANGDFRGIGRPRPGGGGGGGGGARGAGGGRDGAGKDGKDGGKRFFFRRRKVCKFCADKIDYIDYKDVKLLGPFVPERGKVLPRRMFGTCAEHQRKLTLAIKRARNIALLPFASE
jgi:small subunit ribosomal protein S18